MKQGWEIKKLGEVFDLQMGKTPSRDNGDYWGGDNVWVAISDLQDKYIGESKEHITDKALTETKIKKVKAGTTIMSFKLSVGRAAITTQDLYTNEAIMAFNLNEGYDLIADYIYYYLKGYKWQGANKAVMGLTLNKASISQNHIAISPREEQERIVAELDCLSGIIEKKKQQLKELDALAESIFYSMFGDPITNEKGWEVERLGNMCEISSSKRIYAHEYCESGVPFYRGKEITEKGKGNEISVELYISEERYNELKHKYGVPKIGDILITAVGTIGNIWVVDNDSPFYFKDGNVLWLQAKENLNPIYFKALLFNLIDKYKESMANGCAYSALTIVNLKEMQTNKIPLALQQEFADKIEAIEKQKELIKNPYPRPKPSSTPVWIIILISTTIWKRP